MTRHIRLWLAGLATCLTILAGCGSDDATPVADATSISTGETVYSQNCASCHGADLEGTDKGPSQLSVVYEPNHHSDDSYRSAIANGVPQHHWPFGDMPPVQGLSADEVEAVIGFIRSEQEQRGFQPYPP